MKQLLSALLTWRWLRLSLAITTFVVVILVLSTSSGSVGYLSSWGANVRVYEDSSATMQWYPAIAVDSAGNAYAVWQDYRNGISNPDIYFSYRPAGGNWGASVRVNDDVSNRAQSYPAIAVDAAGNAYAVWQDYRDGDDNIYFSYRPAGGQWQPNIKVNDDAGTASQWAPAIAIDAAGNAYAVWDDKRGGTVVNVYASYRPAGGHWQPNVKVNDGSAAWQQCMPAIAADRWGNAYAVWQDSRSGTNNPDIYFSYRPAGGNWQPNVKISDDPGITRQEFPAIVVDNNGTAYAVWQDYRNGNYDIYFSYRPAGGMWQANQNVSYDSTKAQNYPALAVDADGTVYVIWHDYRNNNLDIYFSYRWPGSTWQAGVKVNDDSGTAAQQMPAIAVSPDGRAYAVWQDSRLGNDDIYFSFRPAMPAPPTPTATPSPTATATRTPSSTPTGTNTPTMTPTPTGTNTPTMTPTPTPTETPTETLTETPASTPTTTPHVPSPTLTPTSTSSVEPTPTATETVAPETPTPTPTAPQFLYLPLVMSRYSGDW